MLVVWSVIALLIGVNAVYVAAEFATVGVRRSQIQHLAAQGNHLAARLLPVLRDAARLDRYIAACQIGITLSSLVLGAYGQAHLATALSPLFERWGGLQAVAAQSASALVVLLALTTLQVVLGELVPKSLALQYPTQTALYTVLPMRWSLVLFSWFIAVLNGSGLLILRLLGVCYGGHRHIHSPDEIAMLIAESRDGGLLEPDAQQRLQGALKLPVRPARRLMVPRQDVVAVEASAPVEEVLELLTASPYTRLPVYRGSIDSIVGLLHTKDVVGRLVEDGGVPAVEEVMRPVPHVLESVTADDLLRLMREQRSHQAIVVDEHGGTEGLVTLEDVLSEMLGELGDEFKAPDEAPLERLPDGRVRLPGRTYLDDAAEWVGVPWRGESETVGGLVLETLCRPPEAGERLVIEGVAVEVEAVDGRAVRSVIVTPLGEEQHRDG